MSQPKRLLSAQMPTALLNRHSASDVAFWRRAANGAAQAFATVAGYPASRALSRHCLAASRK
jgi:hypothetical protein